MRKSGKPFSALGLDHAHEQNNAAVKARGGAIGLTEDPSALRRWMIAGPEVQRLISDFACREADGDDEFHHEQTPGFQRKFCDQCFALKETFLKFDNPFQIDTPELIALDTRCVVSEEAVENLHNFEKRGVAAYEQYVKERLVNKNISVHEKIPQIKWQIFSLPKKTQHKSQVAVLKDEVNLFVRLFIICQAREFNLAEFFRHENQMCPPALSSNGILRSGNKSLLVPLLEKLAPTLSKPR